MPIDSISHSHNSVRYMLLAKRIEQRDPQPNFQYGFEVFGYLRANLNFSIQGYYLDIIFSGIKDKNGV